MRTFLELSSLRNKVACVTGGGGNLGSSFCEALAELGAEIAVLDISEEKAVNQAKLLREKHGVRASALCADITSEANVKTAVRDILSYHGRLDILVNNAAYARGSLPPDGFSLQQQNLLQWKAQIDVILTGTFLMTRECICALSSHKKGNVINISSIYGAVGADPSLYSGTEMVNEAHYAAAKGGIIQLTRYMATTLAPHIRVNCIAPGGLLANQPDLFQERYVKRTPMGRMAKVEDFKGGISYLASDLSAYVSGQVLFIDGGWTAW